MKTIKTAVISTFFIGLLILISFPVSAFRANDLKINEILVYNDSNYVDDFGMHSPWIEIFNSAYNTIDIGGRYLTDDPSNLKKYWIPKGDPITQIPPRGYLVFWADNKPARGILHLNFHLEESPMIAIVEADGKTVIDKIIMPRGLQPDISFGRINDGTDEWGLLKKSTPRANNNTDQVISPAQRFSEIDPAGTGMTVVSMSVVFLSLALLYLIFKYLSKIYRIDYSKVLAFKKTEEGKIEVVEEDMTGEVNAAIAMALYLYRSELHDDENTVLTIKKVSRTYSPWSSKIYNIYNIRPSKN